MAVISLIAIPNAGENAKQQELLLLTGKQNVTHNFKEALLNIDLI